MRKIYIDCGVWKGDSIVGFKRYFKGYDIYGFECEPRLKELVGRLSIRYGFKPIYKAVWIEDTDIKLYPGIRNLTQSSSLHISKRKFIDKENPISVAAIDFSKWILDSFKKDDYIICKMNIEGSEYPVLEKMIQDGSIYYIDKLYVAWHYRKLSSISVEKHNELRNKVENITELLGWR